MRDMGQLGRKRLPLAIPTNELQKMLGPSQAFCSRDASNSTYVEAMDRWPFLFSLPLTATHDAPAQ
ncbi:MAG: hypothetical protein WBF06_10585 [Candidatus Acidiferrales bacterium]